MTRILHCLTFIFGVLLLSCPASAQPAAGGKVVFEVTDSLHTPLAYATNRAESPCGREDVRRDDGSRR